MYSLALRRIIKIALFGLGIGFALVCLNGCFGPPQGPFVEDLMITVAPKEGGYPPLPVTITAILASGMVGGQFSFEVEGKTYQQGSGVLRVTLLDLPCAGRVVWEKDGQVPQVATFEVPLINSGPVICPPRLNGIDNAWYLHPRYRYVVDFPGTYDPEGGPVKLIAATVRAELKDVDDTIYCPPYQGPDMFHARTRTGHILKNAFVFHSLWTAPFDFGNVYSEWELGKSYVKEDFVNVHNGAYECIKNHTANANKKPESGSNWAIYWKYVGVKWGTNLSFSPPGYGESGYPNGHCLDYDTTVRPSQMTEITATFEDEQGARTIESWLVPTGADPGCNIYDATGYVRHDLP